MHKYNCYCGLLAHANCMRCGQGACASHFTYPYHRSSWIDRNYGQGKTLDEAAYERGYWSAPNEPFICKNCRDRDGKQHQSQVLAQSRRWRGRDPFRFSMSAACVGYVITEPAVTYDQAVESWLALDWQPIEDVTVSRVVRPEKFKPKRGTAGGTLRPAQYAQDHYRGWEFRRTICLKTGSNPYTDVDTWGWVGSTIITTNGRVLTTNGRALSDTREPTYRLLVEMVRKLFTSRGATWEGPPEGWDT